MDLYNDSEINLHNIEYIMSVRINNYALYLKLRDRLRVDFRITVIHCFPCTMEEKEFVIHFHLNVMR